MDPSSSRRDFAVAGGSGGRKCLSPARRAPLKEQGPQRGPTSNREKSENRNQFYVTGIPWHLGLLYLSISHAV